jgi:hypothetical protein
VDKLLLVLERGAFEVGDNVGDGALDELDFVGDGSALGNGGGGLGLTVAVDVGRGSVSGGRSGGGFFSVETVEFFLGLGDVLVNVSGVTFLLNQPAAMKKKTYTLSLGVLVSLPEIQLGLDFLANSGDVSSAHGRFNGHESAVFHD